MGALALAAAVIAAGAVLGFLVAVILFAIAEWRFRRTVARYEAAVDRFIAAKYSGQIAVFQAELDRLEGWPR